MRKSLTWIIVLSVLLGLWPVSLASAEGDPPLGDPGNLTVHKFHDLNRDGKQDADEPDIEDWLISIYIWNGSGFDWVADGKTDADGIVVFSNLMPAKYKVWEEMPECWEPTTDVWEAEDGGYFTHIYAEWFKPDVRVEFGNVYTCEPPPPSGGEGCTPGYWKQDHHFDSWVGYATDDSFDTIFGVDVGGTLLDALNMKGGKDKALMRHAAAALLNASGGVSYLYSEEEIIAMVQEAFASGDFNGTKALFETQNEAGCPLN